MTPAVAAPVVPAFRVFNEEPGSDFTGMVPAYFAHIGFRESGEKAIAYKFVNETSLRSEDLSDIITNAILSCVKYEDGKFHSIYIHHLFVERFVEEKVSEIVLSTGGDEYSTKGSFTVCPMTTESYNKLAIRCQIALKAINLI